MPTSRAAQADLAALDPSSAELWRSGAAAPLFERLRREEPVHYCPASAFGPYWSVTRHRDIVEVEGQPELYSSSFRHGGITLFGNKPSWFPMFIAMDGAEHKAQRDTVAPAFAPSEMARLADGVRMRTEQVVDSLPIGESFDWVDRVAIELTGQMLATLLGFPWEERRKLIHWSDWAADLQAMLDPELGRRRLEILWECAGAFQRLWREREQGPPTGDLISMMSRSEATRGMSPQEYLGNLILLIVGGNDTTRSAMSALPLVASRWPQQWERLAAEPSLGPVAAQELIRWQSPIAHMRRTATADCALAGRRIRAGDKVVLWYSSANRDEALFEEPDRFIADRANARRHLAFGFGVHRCVGARLAELQIATLLAVLLERGLLPVQDGEAEANASCFLNGYRMVPARLVRG